MRASTAAARSPAVPPCVRLTGEPDLLIALRAITADPDYSVPMLARDIGVDHTLIYRALRRPHERQNRLGIVTCAKLVARYPDLSDAAARYLADAHGWDTVRALAALGLAARALDDDA